MIDWDAIRTKYQQEQEQQEQERKKTAPQQTYDPIEEDIKSRTETKTIPVSTDTTISSPGTSAQSKRVSASDVVMQDLRNRKVISPSAEPTVEMTASGAAEQRQQSARTAYAKRLIESNKAESKSLFKQADDLYHQGDEEGYQQLRQQGESLERTNEKLKEANPEANTSRLADVIKAAGAASSSAVGEIAGQVAGLFGNDELKEKIQNRAAEIGEDSARFTERAKEGLGTVGQAGVDLGINALNMALDAGVAAATGGSSLIPMATRVYGSNAQQARLGGGSELEQVAYGALGAGVEAATERLSSIAGPLKKIYGTGAVDDVIQGLISRVSSKYGQKGLQILASAAGEGAEEAIAGALDPLLQRLTYNEEAEFSGKDIAYDAALGAVMGGLLGTVGGVDTQDGNAAQTSDAQLTRQAQAVPEQEAAAQTNDATDVLLPEPQQAQQRVQDVIEQDIVQNRPVLRSVQEQAQPETDVLEADIKGVGAAERGFDPISRAMNESGVIREREDSNWETPKRIAGGTVSQAADTVIGSVETQLETRDAIEEALAAGVFNKSTVTDKDAWQMAQEVFDTDGYAKALADWSVRADARTTTDYDTPLSILLYRQAQADGDQETAIDILYRATNAGSGAGRKLRQQQMWESMPRAQQMQYLIKEVEKVRSDALKSVKRQAAKTQAGKIKIDKKLKKAFLNASDDAEADAVLQEIYKQVAEQIPNTAKDVINSWRHLSMLANVRSHVKNVSSNVAFSGVRKVADDMSVVAQKAFLKPEAREQAFVGYSAEGKALRKAARADAQTKIVQKGLEGGGKFNDIKGEIDQYRNKFGRNWLGRPFNSGAKVNTALLDLEDTWTSEPAYVKYLSRYLKAKGITAEQFNAMSDTEKQTARDYAVQRSLEAVFRDSNQWSDYIASLGRKDTSAPQKVANAVVESLTPYKRTPANIAVRTFEYSPLNIVKTLATHKQQIDSGETTPAAVIDSISKGVTGSLLLCAGIALSRMGIITGADDDELAAVQGHQNYALELGGKSYTLTNFSPALTMMLVGAEVEEAMQDGVDAEEYLNIITTVLNPVMETTMLSSLNDALENSDSSETPGYVQFMSKVVLGLLGQLYPSMLGATARSIDDTRRTTYTTKKGVAGSIVKALQSLRNRTPYLSKTGQPYIDQWGRTDTEESAWNRVLDNFFNPTYTSEIVTSDMEKELERLQAITGENVMPSYVQKNQSYTNAETSETVAKTLTADEYTQFKITRGQTAYDTLTDLTALDSYDSLTDQEKLDAVKKAYEYSNYTAKKELFGEGFADSEFDKLEGLDVAQWLTAKIHTSEDKMPYDKDDDGNTIDLSRTAKVSEYVNGLDMGDEEKAKMLKALGVDHSDKAIDAVAAGMSYSDYNAIAQASVGDTKIYELLEVIADSQTDSHGKYEYSIAHIGNAKVAETLEQAQKIGFNFDAWSSWQSDLNGKLSGKGMSDIKRQYISNRDWTNRQKVFAAEKEDLITKGMEELMNMGANYDQAAAAKDESDIAQTLMELGHDVGTACIIASELSEESGKSAQRAAIYDIVEENGYSRDVLEDSILAINRQDSTMKIEGGESAFTVLDDDIRSSLTKLQADSDYQVDTLLPGVGDTVSIDGTAYTYDEDDIAAWKEGYKAVYDLVGAEALNNVDAVEKVDSWAKEAAKFFALWEEQGKERDEVPASYQKLYDALNSGFTAEEYINAWLLKESKKADTFDAWRRAGYSERQISALWSIIS